MGIYTGFDIPFPNPSATAYTGGTVVVPAMHPDGSLRVVPAYAAPAGIAPLGVVTDTNDVTNFPTMPVTVRLGGVADCVAGAAVTPTTQNALTWNASGQVIPITTTGSIVPTIGNAIEGCTTLGDKIRVLLDPGFYYHQ
jgi:hypothetical protein